VSVVTGVFDQVSGKLAGQNGQVKLGLNQW
jgi:hypothetical protein